MKIVNKSRWNTAHLRAIANRIARDELTPAKRKVVVLTFKTGRVGQWNETCSGHAWHKGRHAQVNISGQPNGDGVVSDRLRFELAMMIAHELAHLRGIGDERPMRKSIPYGRPKTDEGRAAQREFYAWVLTMPLELKSKPAAANRVGPEEKLAAVEKRMAEWETKLKRAQTALKKYRRKKAYYSRRVAAMKGDA